MARQVNHVVLGLAIPWLDPRDRASLAAVSRACRDLVAAPCPCAVTRVVLPPPPGSAPYAWLATHRTDTLVVVKRLPSPTAEFLDCLDRVGRVRPCPRRVDVRCPFVGDTNAVCAALSAMLAAGVHEVSLAASTPVPPQEAVELRLDPRTEAVDLDLGVDSVRLSGTAASLARLSLRNSHRLRTIRPPDDGFPALRELACDNVRYEELLRDAAPSLTCLRVGDVAELWPHAPHAAPIGLVAGVTAPMLSPRARLELVAGPYMDPASLAGVPATAARVLAPFDWKFEWAGTPLARSLQELELDMAHWCSDEFAFARLAAMPRLRTLGLRNVRRMSSADDLVAWSMTGLPPSLRRVWAVVPVDAAVDPPRDIQRYVLALLSVYKLPECACDLE